MLEPLQMGKNLLYYYGIIVYKNQIPTNNIVFKGIISLQTSVIFYCKTEEFPRISLPQGQNQKKKQENFAFLERKG